MTWASSASAASESRSVATTVASIPSRCSTRSALTFRMPLVPMPAPQIVTIFTARPPRMARTSSGRWSRRRESASHGIRIVEHVRELGDERQVPCARGDGEGEHDAHRVVVRMPERRPASASVTTASPSRSTVGPGAGVREREPGRDRRRRGRAPRSSASSRRRIPASVAPLAREGRARRARRRRASRRRAPRARCAASGSAGSVSRPSGGAEAVCR